MNTGRKKDYRDRNDGYFLKGLDSMHVIMPYVMPTRSANEAVLSEEIDITAVESYIKAKSAENPDIKYTWFNVVCAALAKVLILKPKMNYFITAHRMYEKKDIEIAFVVKRKMEENSEEALAKLKIDRNGGSLIDQVYHMTSDFVNKVRVEDRTEGITNQFNAFQMLPRFILKFVVGCLRIMDYFGRYPESLKSDDPCYSSLFITNLGSIKMNANYHHLMEWGTNSFFVVVGERKKRPVFSTDGSYVMRNTIPMSFTIDERIADGFYFSKSIKLFKYIIQHPELLELDASAPIEI